MKKLLTIIGVAAMLATVTHAQTSAVDTHVNAAMADTSAKTNSILGDIGQVGKDFWAALGSANFGNGVTVEPFALYHAGDFGGGLAVETSSTNGVNVGFALAAINDSQSKKFDFYDATLNIQLGRQVTVPIIKIPAYLYIETGPALNLAHLDTVLEQSVAGAKIFFDANKLSFGGGIGQNSEWPSSPFYVVHFSYTF